MTQPSEGHESSMKVCASPFKMGDTVKLREPPKAFTTKPLSKDSGGRVNSPGYSNNVKDATMGDPQPSPKDSNVYGCSSTTRRQWVLLQQSNA
jgi:hypothetical protein